MISESVGSIAARQPAATTVLLHHGIDFCCGGERTLGEACRAAGVDPATVAAEIDRADQAGGEGAEGEPRWDRRPLPELIEHILSRYHAVLRRDLPALVDLARKVEAAHAAHPRRPVGVAAHLAAMREAVESHLAKEEQILFPLILAGRGSAAHMPVRVMNEEHEDHGRNLAELRRLASGYAVPDGACASWRALYEGLAALERDLFEHIHLENNVLFPRALAG
jgi:regulator of cell morphogenesis and NO signaling